MNKFITGPYPDYKMVNLENVSNIAFEDFVTRSGEQKYKIIFNFNYGVSLKNDFGKQIADYVYFIYDSKDEYLDATVVLSELINTKSWIAPLIENEVARIVNPKEISFLAQDLRKNRIILNLATTVSFHGNVDRKTSDFLYFDFPTYDEYLENLKYIQAQLGSLVL